MSQTPPQAPKKSKSIYRRTPVVVALITTAGLIIVAIIGKLSFPSSSSTPTPIPSPTSALTSTAIPSPTATPTASIVPAASPSFSDPLRDNSMGFNWDVGTLPQGQTCGFVTDKGYLLTSPANLGVGCWTEASQSNFSNLVYQIKMTILSGLDNTGSGGTTVGAGAQFRVDTQNDSLYEILFDVKGNWNLLINVKGNRSIVPSSNAGARCGNPCSYFRTGYNQPNVITVWDVGSKIDVYINGYLLDSCSDATLTSGHLGVRLSPGTTFGSVAFSDLKVWQL